MAPASRKNLSAAAAAAAATIVLLLIIVATCESASVAEQTCRHLSGTYQGPCVYNPSCYYVCKDESTGNIGGACDTFRCWCYTECPSEIVAADASAPIQP